MYSKLNILKAVLAQLRLKLLGGKGEFAELQEKTALIFENTLPNHVCEKLVKKIDNIVDDRLHGRVWRDQVGSDVRILGFENEIIDFIDFFDVKKQIKAVEEYTGQKVKSWFLMANRVVHRDGNLGSGGGMHRDSPFSNQVKCIWYLNDVTEENGPFQYIPNSHVNQLKLRGVYSLGETRFPTIKENLVEVTAKMGTLLVCDTKCIHGGKSIIRGVRYAVTLYTLPQSDGVEKVFRKSNVDTSLAVRNLKIN